MYVGFLVCWLACLLVCQLASGGGRGGVQFACSSLQAACCAGVGGWWAWWFAITPAHTRHLAALAGTARRSADACAQTKYLSAFGLMYNEALVVDLERAFRDILRNAQVLAGELVVGCAALA